MKKNNEILYKNLYDLKRFLRHNKLNYEKARIRGCYGYIIRSCDNNDDGLKYLFSKLRSKDLCDYNIYSIRHCDNNWDEPRYLVNKPILANRYGWFITNRIIKFNNDDEIRLNHKTLKIIESDDEIYEKVTASSMYGIMYNK